MVDAAMAAAPGDVEAALDRDKEAEFLIVELPGKRQSRSLNHGRIIFTI
ncbi:MAG: hypothetical protein R6V59_01485 [Dehalococcoidia bacterium]